MGHGISFFGWTPSNRVSGYPVPKNEVMSSGCPGSRCVPTRHDVMSDAPPDASSTRCRSTRSSGSNSARTASFFCIWRAHSPSPGAGDSAGRVVSRAACTSPRDAASRRLIVRHPAWHRSRFERGGSNIDSLRRDASPCRPYPYLRSFPIGQNFYCPTRSGIDVVRVLSGARDIPSLF